jgi:hypothetical protein
MKKAKVMLTAIAVMAVVGGALAFKAKKFGSTIYCTDSATGVCKFEKSGFTLNPNGVGVQSFCVATDTWTTTCPRITITTQE